MANAGEVLEWRAVPAWGLLPVVLIADTSGSMEEHGKLQTVQHCLRELIDELSGEPWSDSVRVGFVGLGDETAPVVPLTPLSTFEIPPLVASGRSMLGAAIEQAASMLGQLEPSTPAHAPLVLLLADGGWDDSWRAAMASFLAGSGCDSIRVCVAIGADADRSSMTGFSEEVVTVDTLPELASYLCTAPSVSTAERQRGSTLRSPQFTSDHQSFGY
jgi:uncharacterized protein YegL